MKGLARVAAATSGDLLARLHAIWGLGQVGRIQFDGQRLSSGTSSARCSTIAEAEVRAQAAKVLGEVREAKAFDGLIALLRDDSPRVRFVRRDRAGQARPRRRRSGRCWRCSSANGDKDPYLRHAAVMGLVGSGEDPSALERAAGDASPAARMGVLLAMRRLGDPEIARFLKDADPRLVLEAARAINDVPIDERAARLAAVPMTSRHALAAAATVCSTPTSGGAGADDAAALAEAAGRSDLPAAVRVQALEMLGSVGEPAGPRRGHGPLAADRAAAGRSRPPTRCGRSSRPSSPGRRTRSGPRPSMATAGLGIKEAGADLAALAADRDQSDQTRAEALKALDNLKRPPPRRRRPPRRCSCRARSRSRGAAGPRQGRPRRRDRARAATGSSTAATAERQGAIAVLAAMPGDAARQAISPPGSTGSSPASVPAEIQLDLIEAAGRAVRARRPPTSSSSTRIVQAQGRPARRVSRSPRRRRRPARHADLHRPRPRSNASAATRSAARNGEIPGGEVGPELTGIGARQDRTVPPRIDRRPQQADRPGLRVGRAGHQRRQGHTPASSAARTTRRFAS